MSIQEEDEKATKHKKKVFVGETAEEIAECLAGQVPEQDFERIMAVINSGLGSQVETNITITDESDMPMHKTYEDESKQEKIFLLKTSDSIRIVPVLMHTKGKLKFSLDISSEEDSSVLDQNQSSFNLASDVKIEDGLTPLISIPYKHEGNDNEASINKVMDFFLQKYAAHIEVEELDCFGQVMSGKVITVK